MPNKRQKTAHEAGSDERSLSLLENLPTEIVQNHVALHLSDQDLHHLSRTSHTMFNHCVYPLIKRLLTHILRGEEDEALEMICANPNLLLSYGNANDYSGRVYREVTPFQAALLSHDVRIGYKILPLFKQINKEGFDAQEEKAKQFNTLFPEGLPDQKPYDFSIIIQVISESSAHDLQAALEKKQNNTPLCLALNAFRKEFTSLAQEEIFFNPQHLIKAFEVYRAQFDTWSQVQCDLFWRQVIGYIQRFVPTCYAQAFCQGLLSVVLMANYTELPEALLDGLCPRLLRFRDQSSYYPLTDSPALGFDDAVDSGGLVQGDKRLKSRWYKTELGLNQELLEQLVENAIWKAFQSLSEQCNIRENVSRAPTP